MATVTLTDIETFLENRCENSNVQYDADDVQNHLPELHNDHLFDALVDTEPAEAPEHLHEEFTQRDDVFTATELVVEYVNRTFTSEVQETLPRDVVDSFIRCSARVLEHELDGVYETETQPESESQSDG